VKCFILGSNKIHRQYESIIKEELNIDDKNYELSFSQENNIPKGRFQVIDSGKNFKIIDGAHNPAGVDAFFNLLEETYTKDEIESLDC